MKKWYAVIGDPISHSLSPKMHHQWFDEHGIDATYIPIRIAPEQLAVGVESLKLLGASGWNVTIPHKTAIIPFLDGLDDSAVKIGAVNTVIKSSEGRYIGFNTDGLGFVRSLEEEIGENHKNKKLLLIGAGGAARGIAHALDMSGYSSITIANRSFEKAEQLRDELSDGKAITLKEAEVQLSRYEIIIHTTSAGMKNDVAALPLSLTNLKDHTVVADIVYNPIMTPILQHAHEMGLTTVNGVGMFVHQGALAFEYWTGIRPNTVNMKNYLTELLGGNYVNG